MLPISGNGSFTFGTKLSDGAAYNVTIKTQPTGSTETCVASNNSGTVLGANSTTVSVICTTNANTIGSYELMASDDSTGLGYSVSVSSDGNTAVVGAFRDNFNNSGAVYVYK